MKQNYLLSDLRKAAQVLLSAAVKETFPHVMLVGGRVTPLGFYSDFIFPFEFQKSFLPLLEEGMLRLVKSGADFELNEMVPLSAEAFFSHKGELYRAQDVKEVEDSLVTLITLGSFCDFTLEEFVCESTSDVGAFKLKSFEKIGRRDGKEVVRIFGAADFDKQSLKDFLKQESSIVQKIHTNIGEKLSLFSPFNEEGSLFFWRPKGAALIQSLDRFIFESLEQAGFARVIAPSSDSIAFYEDEEECDMTPIELERRSLYFLNSKEKRLFEQVHFWFKDRNDYSAGLILTPQNYFDIEYNFCDDKQVFEQCISSLQFISEMLKILSFEFKIIFSVRKGKSSSLTNGENICAEAVKKALQSTSDMPLIHKTHSTFKGVRVEFMVADALGREWSTGFLQVSFPEKEGKRAVLITSLLGSRERIIALMLEKHGGIPLLLAKNK